jgi:hypothetical protein
MLRSCLLVAVALVALSAVGFAPAASATPAAEPSVDDLYDERGRLLPGAAELLEDDDGHATPAAIANPRVRSSGMWTSRRPAEGGAYRWRIMAVGVGVLALSGLLLLRFIRRVEPAPPARR